MHIRAASSKISLGLGLITRTETEQAGRGQAVDTRESVRKTLEGLVQIT